MLDPVLQSQKSFSQWPALENAFIVWKSAMLCVTGAHHCSQQLYSLIGSCSISDTIQEPSEGQGAFHLCSQRDGVWLKEKCVLLPEDLSLDTTRFKFKM